MKRLSDYQGEEAIELWADLLEPISTILADPKIKETYESGKPKLLIAKEIIKLHKKEAIEIIGRVDPSPINGLNLIVRVVSIVSEIEEADELKSFFDTGAQAQTDNGSSGSVTESTEGEEA